MKLRPVIIIALALLCNAVSLYSQSNGTPEKQKTTTKLLWFDFVETIKFNKKWTLQAEYSPRFTMDPAGVYQNLIRAYGLYNVGENWSVGLGFCTVFSPVNDFTTHELRPEQWFIYKQQLEKAKRLGITHRIKLEERFARKSTKTELEDGYNLTMRYRYRLGFDYILVKIGKKENPLKYFVNDEIFLQSGETITYNIFDQNRFYTGLSYRVAKGLTLAAGYMNIYKQTRAGNVYDRNHTFRFSIQHELVLKGKKDKAQ